MPHTVEEQPRDSFMPMNGKTGAPLALAMQQLLLGGTITPAGSRLVVKHTFASADTQPVEVVYTFALPRDAALRSFTVRGPGYAAQSEMRPVAEATAAYELGIEQGHLAVLARTYRDGMVSDRRVRVHDVTWVEECVAVQRAVLGPILAQATRRHTALLYDYKPRAAAAGRVVKVQPEQRHGA